MLKQRARELRKNQTDSEKILWKILRNRQIENLKFHRQYVIGNYIVDFVNRECDLIIEVDCGQHNDSANDKKRTKFLEDEGYKVIRFWNNEVINNLDGVLDKIVNEIKTLTPTLSLKGEGGIAKFKPRYKAQTSDLALGDWEKLPAASAEWVNALRNRARLSVEETGLPTPKLERWKYNNLPVALKKIKVFYGDADINLSGLTDYAYSFPKGMLHFPQWAQDMIEMPSPSHEKYGDMMLWQAANAYLRDGYVLDVPENANGDRALNVTLSGHDGGYYVPRQIIRVGAGAAFTLIEYQSGSGAYWSNIVTQIKIAKGAKLKHYRFQENAENAVITQNTHIEMEEGAEYEAFTLTTGAGNSRNQIHVDMKGKRAICRLNGVNMLDGSRLADTTLTVDHHALHGHSYQNYRNVVADKATGVFQGKVHVHKPAQKTDGYQMAKSLLLSQEATVNTKPELEIYADDVKCSHGATTGRLDDDALFYLRARGIPEGQARNLLIQAFVAEVIEEITDASVSEQAAHIVQRWLDAFNAPKDGWNGE